MTSAETGELRDRQCPAGDEADRALDAFAMTDTQFLREPKPLYALLRHNDPIHHDEKTGLHLVSRYEDIQTVLRDAVTFSQELGWKQQFARGYIDELKAILIRDGGGFFPEVLLLDPPAHTRIRKLLEKALSARQILDLEARVQELVVERIEAIADRGEAEAISEFASALTIRIICEQLGFPFEEAGDKVMSWARAYSAQLHVAQSHEDMVANAATICELQNFIIARVREREAQKREDIISDLMCARLEDEDAQLTFEETVALTRGLLLAGNDTTSRAIGNFMHIAATQPDVIDRLYPVIDDNAQVNRFVEELLRYAPSVRGLFRIATRDVELGGKLLPAGAHLVILFASGNDDETIFDCPHSFDSSRRNVVRHLSFGGGIHLCAGIALARMELRIVVREVVKRLKDIRLAIPAEEVRYIPSATVQGFESLPLTFSRR